MWSDASLPATGWRTAICCCARARRTTPCSAAEGNDVHRPLRAGTGGETHRAAHLAPHPVPGAEPGGPAAARVPAPRGGAGPRHRRSAHRAQADAGARRLPTPRAVAAARLPLGALPPVTVHRATADAASDRARQARVRLVVRWLGRVGGSAPGRRRLSPHGCVTENA